MKERKILSLLISVALILCFLPSATYGASALKICAKKTTGVLRVAGKCKASERTINNLSLLQGAKGDTGSTGPEGPSSLLGLAQLKADGTLASSKKGSGVTGIASARTDTGWYTVTLTGAFSTLTGTGDQNKLKVIVLPDAGDSTTGAILPRAHVDSASSTSIVVGVEVYRYSTGSWEDGPARVAIFLGE